jgi:galactose oxidase
VDVGQDSAIDLSYVCGNRFLITNAYGVPVSVTYRVAGSGEEGSAELEAAPAIDPAVSERMIETRTAGTVQIFLNGKPLVARANDGVPCTPAPSASQLVAATSAEAGQWTAPFNWPIVAVHMVLLPNGRVLTIGRTGTPQVWNPATGSFSAVPSPAWLFCAGHALLPDGRVFLAGGHISDNHGLPNTTLFSSASNSWSSSARMGRGRWYPTVTITGSGDAVIMAGRDEAGLVVNTPEVWSSGSIRRLTGAQASLPYYPRTFLAPDGSLYVAGAPAGTRFLSISGTGSWRRGPTKMMAREYGSAVMYDDGRILYAGGARTTNSAEVIDLNNQASPAWRWTGSMAFARRHLNLTVLPTGEVLATGGVAGTIFNDVAKGVRAAELWNPATGQWTTLASNAVTRGYHGTSLLLPDGRVLNSGSGEGAGAPNQRNAELFSPPYLFRGARPVISSTPSSIQYGTTFRLLTAQASGIRKVSMIRLGAVTHAFDENQRFQRLAFTANATGLTVTAPASRNRTPPGHYLIFILNGSDVPSVGKIVRIN